MQDAREQSEVLSLNHVRSGDVVFMNRRCLSMKDPLSMGLCLLTKTESRFDHVGMVLKIDESELSEYPAARQRMVDRSPSGTYVLETNRRGITLYAAEKRMNQTSANEVVTRTVTVGDVARQQEVQKAFLTEMESLYDTPYEKDVRHLLPSLLSPPDKMDRVRAAHKINNLRLEVDALTAMSDLHPGRSPIYGDLIQKYQSAQAFLLSTYFPHLRPAGTSDPLARDWGSGHFWVDGINDAPKMVCSELICNLWRRAGLTEGFVPASSMRPFDLLDNERFNFRSPCARFGDLVPIKVSSAYAPTWKTPSDARKETDRTSVPTHAVLTEEQRLLFFNEINVECGLPPAASLDEAAFATGVLPSRWVVQSNAVLDVVPHLGFRVFATGALFAACTVPCAPLTMRWLEGQVGLSLLRGSVWSLTSGLAVRNFTFAAVQGALIAVASRRYVFAEDELVMRKQTPGRWVDTRHPFYDVVGLYALFTPLAHFISMPLYNATIAHHFGPARPGPLTMRQLCKGGLLTAPLALLLPLQAFWLSWYETAGSLVIPTPSSVWRPREDLLRRPEWPHFRNDAIAGAYGFTLLTDLALYPLTTLATRRFIREIYAPQRPPSFGTSLYAGYRHRLLSNLFILSASTVYLLALGSI